MYYSEFTLQLIDEVKKHEILYNTRYEKRPKTEKDEAWRLVAESMNGELMSSLEFQLLSLSHATTKCFEPYHKSRSTTYLIAHHLR